MNVFGHITTELEDQAIVFWVEKENQSRVDANSSPLSPEEYVLLKIEDILRDMIDGMQRTRRKTVAALYDQLSPSTQIELVKLTPEQMTQMVISESVREITVVQ